MKCSGMLTDATQPPEGQKERAKQLQRIFRLPSTSNSNNNSRATATKHEKRSEATNAPKTSYKMERFATDGSNKILNVSAFKLSQQQRRDINPNTVGQPKQFQRDFFAGGSKIFWDWP